jgi:hypothetical protein
MFLEITPLGSTNICILKLTAGLAVRHAGARMKMAPAQNLKEFLNIIFPLLVDPHILRQAQKPFQAVSAFAGKRASGPPSTI